jgi:hypothetical protein
MPTPASKFRGQKKRVGANVLLRLFQFIQACEDLGLKVILGEQSIEYLLFKRICTGQLVVA